MMIDDVSPSDFRSEPRRLRVAYFAGTMRPGHDGVTRVLYKLIDHLVLTGVPNIFFSPIVPPLSAQRVRMREVPSIAFPLYKDYRIAVPGYKRFEDEVLRFQPDLLHINSPCSLGYAAIRLGAKHGIPAVATYHTHFPSYARYYNLPLLEKLGWQYLRNLYNACKRVYVPSAPILDELAANGIRNLELLPHGVDTDIFSPSWKDETWKQRIGAAGKEVLLFAGRLVWEKDLRVLADAWDIIRAERPDTVLVFAGEGPARDELRNLVPRAIFLGHQEGKDLSTAFASSDLFVFPSTTETFGNVVLEAMASGLPTVGARKGGVAGVIADGRTGILSSPHDAADFAAKTIALIGNHKLRTDIRERGLAHARTQTWGSVFSRMFESYYITVLAHARRIHMHRKAA